MTPPVPTGGLEQWFAASGFSTEAVKSPVTLIINNESTALKVCSVTFAPKETTTTLEKVLVAAEAESAPAACVTGHAAESRSDQSDQRLSGPGQSAVGLQHRRRR